MGEAREMGDHARVLALRRADPSLGCRTIGKRLGINHNRVAGIIHRAEHGVRRRPFRDEARVREAIALCDAVGPCEASRRLGVGRGILGRWRARRHLLTAEGSA